MSKCLRAVCIGVVLWGGLQAAWAADPLLDFGLVTPPPPGQRAIVEPVVSWLVNPDPPAYCSKTTPRDGFVNRPEGCVVWHRASSRCTIVTRAPTTHSQLGHLFLHCLHGR